MRISIDALTKVSSSGIAEGSINTWAIHGSGKPTQVSLETGAGRRKTMRKRKLTALQISVLDRLTMDHLYLDGREWMWSGGGKPPHVGTVISLKKRGLVSFFDVSLFPESGFRFEVKINE